MKRKGSPFTRSYNALPCMACMTPREGDPACIPSRACVSSSSACKHFPTFSSTRPLRMKNGSEKA